MSVLEVGIIPATILTIIFLLMAWRFLFVAKQKKRRSFSYETKESRSNIRIWRAANLFAGKMALLIGLAVFTFGYSLSLMPMNHTAILFSVCGMMLLAIVLFFMLTNNYIKIFARQLRHRK